MFKSLKDKLKNWTEKVKKEIVVPSEEDKKKPKKKGTEKKKQNKKKGTIKKNISHSESANESLSTNKKKNKKVNYDINHNKQTREKKTLKEITSAQEGNNTTTEETLSDKNKKKSFKSIFTKQLTEEKFEELFEELSLTLLQNNVAYSVVEKIKEDLKEKLIGEKSKTVDLENSLTESIEKLLIESPKFVKEIKDSLKEQKPYVILFAGINGSGKTTTIARIAHLLKKEKLSVCLAAADTFRSAAIEQLEKHSEKLKISIIKKDYNSDPASVGFEAIKYAKKNKIDIVLIDTAGRMNSSESLMKEIVKISRVCNPDLKIFVGESITGNDATNQAKSFNDTIGLDGIILTKADIDEKAGTILSVSYVTKKPIYFLGVGQGYDDLEIFDKKKIIGRIFS